ncbi:negative regulator of early meiotic expression, partial [Scheffersomyces stipitis CBS 6054]
MSTLIPTSSACHNLQLPHTEKDDRLNLNVRTGSSSTLYNSLVLTSGGLTIGLELGDTTIEEIYTTFRQKVSSSVMKFKSLDKYLSGELFYLSLIDKVWSRVPYNRDTDGPRPKPRLFHQICALNNCVYLFGGLVIPEDANPTSEDDTTIKDFLVPCNDLWSFNLESNKWRLLSDGSEYETNRAIPQPRFNHKMTTINSLSFVNKKDHYGIFIAGGKDGNSNPIYDNAVFDLVENKYVGSEPIKLKTTTGNVEKDSKSGLDNIVANDKHELNVDYNNSMIVTFTEDIDHQHHQQINDKGKIHHEYRKSTSQEQSFIIYTPTIDKSQDQNNNPLVSFRAGRKIHNGKPLPMHRKKLFTNGQNSEGPTIDRRGLNHTIPFNLRYPTGGLFGQNIVITGFLPGDFDISIFIYNKPTGKWSRLNIFCNHDYGSHRFWGGFAWQSHHKVVLIGNYLTSRTTSSIRFFTVMITVSLPITNILASSELAGGHHHGPDGRRIPHRRVRLSNASENASNRKNIEEELSDDSSPEVLTEEEFLKKTSDRRPSSISQASDKTSPTAISFSEYVHYAAPKTNFTSIRSVFPPAAITLGRNAFDRYGDLISDFELVSCNGDRIPVSLIVLMERWGRYFIQLLARGYVSAVDKFESDQALGVYNSDKQRLRTSKSGGSGKTNKEPSNPLEQNESEASPEAIPRKDSVSSFSSSNSLLASQLQDIPPQLPLPSDQIPGIPAAPASFKSSTSRKGSQDLGSPRASLIHTLTALRNIPISKSPRESPFASPRASVSAQGASVVGGGDLYSSPVPNLRPGRFSPTSEVMGRSKSIDYSLSAFNEESAEQGNKTEPSQEMEREQKNASLSSTHSEALSATSSGRDSNDDDFSGASEADLLSQACKAAKESHGMFDNALLNFENLDAATFTMEPSLIPRKLYVPFPSITLKGFCEYLYTGQVGNKWLLVPTTLDNLLMSKFFKVPLLYDLISEVLFGIIGRKEAYIVKEGNRLKRKYFNALEEMGKSYDNSFKFPLNEYEGFMDTVDDGYLDIALLKKTSKTHQSSSVVSMSRRRRYQAEHGNSRRPSTATELTEPDEEAEDENEVDDEKEKEKEESQGSNLHSESAEDSSDRKTTSTSEDDGIELGFLNVHERNSTTVGPRSKSVFDRSNTVYNDFFQHAYEQAHAGDDNGEKAVGLTIEQLVSPDSDIPNDYVIDLVYEASSIVTDLKLMLRAANVRLMNKILNQSRVEVEAEIERLKNSQMESDLEDSDDGGISTSKANDNFVAPKAHTSVSATHMDLNPSTSASSLVSSGSSKAPKDLEKMKSNISFRTVGSLTPFKHSKTENKIGGNKDIDKRFSKLMKKDEKLRTKEGLLKKKVMSKSSTSLNEIGQSTASSIMSKSTTQPKKHHGLFHRSHKKKDTDDSSLESTKLSRTQSTTASIESAHS